MRKSLWHLWAAFSAAVVFFVVAALFGITLYRGLSTMTWRFLTAPPAGFAGDGGGIFPAIAGSLALTATAGIMAMALALPTALYMAFYAEKEGFIHVVKTAMATVASVPSIVLGLFIYATLIRRLGLPPSWLTASATLALMIFPYMEVGLEKAAREVPQASMRHARALGVSTAFAIRRIALPEMMPAIAKTLGVQMAFAMGATAPIMITGAVLYAGPPESLLKPVMALPLHLYILISEGRGVEEGFRTAAVLVLLLWLLQGTLGYLWLRRRRR